MAEIKVVISQKGKAKQVEAKEDVASNLQSKKIGDKVNGEIFDLPGYELEITGGSDRAGKAMRKDIDGPVKKRILAVSGIGVKKKRKGMRQRKLVVGNTINENITQVNMKVLKAGKQPLFEEKKEGDASAEKAAEKPAGEKKPAEEKKE